MATILYPSDLTDAAWRLVAPLLPPAESGGRPRSVDLRHIRERPLLFGAQRLRLALSATLLLTPLMLLRLMLASGLPAAALMAASAPLVSSLLAEM